MTNNKPRQYKAIGLRIVQNAAALPMGGVVDFTIAEVKPDVVDAERVAHNIALAMSVHEDMLDACMGFVKLWDSSEYPGNDVFAEAIVAIHLAVAKAMGRR